MAKLTETLMAAWDRIFDGDNSGPIANVKATAASVASTIAQVAQALLDSEPSTLSSNEEKVRFCLMSFSQGSPKTLRAFLDGFSLLKLVFGAHKS